MLFTHPSSRPGFTLVEVLVVVPVVILLISSFVAAIVVVTGDALVARGRSDLVYSTHNSLDNIEQDIRLSEAYLPIGSILPVSPQGSNDGTLPFVSLNSSSVLMILQTYATTTNPASSDRQIVYLSNQPNACGSAGVSSNTPLKLNIIYFIKDRSLYRRVIVPQNTSGSLTQAVCSGSSSTTNVSSIWQRSNCSDGLVNGTTCLTDDDELIVSGIDSYEVKYYSSAGSTTEIADSQLAKTASIKINAKKTIAGRDVEYSATMRATRRNGSDQQGTGSLSEAFEDSNLVFNFTGDWEIVTTDSSGFNGTQSYRNKIISHSQSSQTQINVNLSEAGRVEFRYKVSSESGFDRFRFLADGVEQLNKSGSIGWTMYSLDLAAGNHTLTWSYTKDGSVSSGEDSAYIDDLTISGF